MAAASILRGVGVRFGRGKSTLNANKPKIERFLSGTKEKTTITHQFPYPVGVSLLNGRTDAAPASKVMLVLIKDVRRPEGYFLLTGFPEK
ncbi:RNase A-like domain-containing protein [Pseudomonas sp. NFX15]|uniref:RNase A-like domain-containing protein n=1 Tax=Pseudomonas sp. NFX15 TaxID=2816958 RepID=UPI003BA28054